MSVGCTLCVQFSVVLYSVDSQELLKWGPPTSLQALQRSCSAPAWRRSLACPKRFHTLL